MISSRFIYGIKANLRIMLAIGMIIIGAIHFTNPEPFACTMPDGLPHSLAFIYGSGLIEVLAGAGLLLPTVSPVAAWTLVALYLAAFSANWYQAIYNSPVADWPQDSPLIWLRISTQVLLVAWAWWLTRD